MDNMSRSNIDRNIVSRISSGSASSVNLGKLKFPLLDLSLDVDNEDSTSFILNICLMESDREVDSPTVANSFDFRPFLDSGNSAVDFDERLEPPEAIVR